MGICRVNKLQHGFRNQRNRVRIRRLTRSLLQLKKNNGLATEVLRSFRSLLFSGFFWNEKPSAILSFWKH